MKKFQLKAFYIMSLALLMPAIQSCREDSFRIEGDIAGADGSLLLLQRPGFNGEWLTVDSTRTGSDGHFSIRSEAPENPEIYRLCLGERPVYFPVDSTESITLTSSAAAFGSEYTLAGSDNAVRMRDFDIALLKASKGGADQVAALKKKAVTEIILPSKGNILAYYVLTKGYGGNTLFSVDNPDDAGIFGAVATSYAQYRPDDPRSAMLEKMALEARRNRNKSLGRKTVVEAKEVAAIPISLTDAKGRKQELSQYLGNGKPVAVIFSPLNEADSPEVNRRIAALYSKYQGKAVFYQVCPDTDIIAWRDAAANLPWIVVNDPDGTASANIRSYNVTSLPAFFIYDKAGELSASAFTIEDFAGKLASAVN